MAKNLLEQVEDNKKEIRSIYNNKKVRLVALSSALTSTIILKAVHDLMATYTNYEIEIIMQETNNLDSLLKNQNVDVVISLKRTKSKETSFRTNFKCTYKACLFIGSKVRRSGYLAYMIKQLVTNTNTFFYCNFNIFIFCK